MGGDAAVQRGRQLQGYQRPPLALAHQIAGVQRLGLVAQQARLDGYTGIAQPVQPAPFTRGSGSSVAATTRATPASISASAQGGVCP